MNELPCGKKKIVHMSEDSADRHRDSLGDRYGTPPNSYLCDPCSDDAGQDIWHVGYGHDAGKLSKRARRHRGQQAGRKRAKNK